MWHSGYELESAAMKEVMEFGSSRELRRGSPSYHSVRFSFPPDSEPPPSSLIRHLKHSNHWPKSPRTPQRQSLGKKHEGMPGKFPATEPAGDRGQRITILSIDGGGVRGIIPSTILELLETYLQVHSQLRIPFAFPQVHCLQLRCTWAGLATVG